MFLPKRLGVLTLMLADKNGDLADKNGDLADKNRKVADKNCKFADKNDEISIIFIKFALRIFRKLLKTIVKT